MLVGTMLVGGLGVLPRSAGVEARNEQINLARSGFGVPHDSRYVGASQCINMCVYIYIYIYIYT